MMTPTRRRDAAFTWLLAARTGNSDVRPDFTVVDSIAQLREVMQRDDQNIRIKPGTYRVEDTWPDDAQSVFIVSESNQPLRPFTPCCFCMRNGRPVKPTA